MKNIYLSLLLSLLFITNIFGQNILEDAIDELRLSIKDVVTKSTTYEQSIEWDAETPHKLIFKQNKVGKKKTIAMSYEFSLKDIDKNTIRVKNKKDLMTISIFMNNKQNLIKVFKDGEQGKYTKETAIMALDNDNGKDVAKLLKEVIKLTKDIKSSCEPGNFDARITWLSENIQTFQINQTTFEQTFSQTTTGSPLVSYTVIERAKKTKEENWTFNLADLNTRKIQLQVKDKYIYVEVETKRNLKYIHYEKDGELANYTQKIKFFMPDFDQARCLMAVLEKLIADSEKIEKEKYKKLASLNDALAVLSKNVKSTKGKGIEITQSMTTACVTEFARTEQKEKKDAIEELFKFNWSDIQVSSVKVKVKGKTILVELSTGKTNLIQPFKNGEIQKYVAKLTINASDLENAKMLAFILPEAIGFCKKEMVFTPNQDVNKNLKWISEQLAKVNDTGGIHQSIKSIEGEDCKWQFTSIKAGKKQDKEEIYEFNMENLDEKGIKFKITGKILSIEINTRHHEKVIKYYKDGEPDDYKNAFLIQLNDLEDARNMIRVFEEGIKGCKE